MNFRDFTQHKFDLMSGIFLFLVIVLCMLHFSHHAGDGKALEWALHAADLVLGVIIGGMQMSRGMRREDPRPDGAADAAKGTHGAD